MFWVLLHISKNMVISCIPETVYEIVSFQISLKLPDNGYNDRTKALLVHVNITEVCIYMYRHEKKSLNVLLTN